MSDVESEREALNAALEPTIIELLHQRDGGATICPSEAARAVASRCEIGADGWRDLMPAARTAAAHLVESGHVEVTQQGRIVDLSTARGPIRLRLAEGAAAQPQHPRQP